MKPSEITAGKTYSNRGKGTTKRTVIEIGERHRPKHYFGSLRPLEPCVLYEQDGKRDVLYLSSFASWAGKEVDE